MAGRSGQSRWVALLLLAVLALVAYAPMFSIPLLEDDYPNLWQSISLGAPSQAGALLANPVFRLRATSFWIMYALWPVGKLGSFLYHAVSLALHIANVWLLYAICLAWPRMRAAAFWAAAFFAVQEGHQEAVMWFSAINELLQFFFGMGALWCWMLRERGRLWQVGGVLLFGMALLSKESAVVLLPLMALVAGPSDWRRTAKSLAPYLMLGAVAVLSVLESRTTSFRFSDGSFSLHARFWLTWPRNLFRVLWIWGLPAITGLFLAKDRKLRTAALWALAWIGIGLAPYSFLTYSTQIPSRQTYIASVGLALLVGLAMAYWSAQWQGRRWLVGAVAALVLVHNVGYLWTKKRSQFLERAAPTDQLIALARRTPGPIWVRCFPRHPFIADGAVNLAAGYAFENLVWNEADALRLHATAVFCYQQAKR